MDIFGKPGKEVMVTNDTIKHGRESDQEKVKKHLTIGMPYTVERIDVHNWTTDVYLVEVPGVRFNSVSFVDIEKLDTTYWVDIKKHIAPDANESKFNKEKLITRLQVDLSKEGMTGMYGLEVKQEGKRYNVVVQVHVERVV